jgi:hypothetical protein
MKFELLLFVVWVVVCTVWIYNMMDDNERQKRKKRQQQSR